MSDGAKIVTGIITVAVVIIVLMVGIPLYLVWQQGLSGKAELKKAEQNRQIKIQEAMAVEESATHLAKADVKRAEGVAQSNKIIGGSLKENEAYLWWLWIEGMKESTGKTVVYVPTESQLPVLEANRFNKMSPPGASKK